MINSLIFKQSIALIMWLYDAVLWMFSSIRDEGKLSIRQSKTRFCFYNDKLLYICIFYQEILILPWSYLPIEGTLPFFPPKFPLKCAKYHPKTRFFPQKFLILPRIPGKKSLFLLLLSRSTQFWLWFMRLRIPSVPTDIYHKEH